MPRTIAPNALLHTFSENLELMQKPPPPQLPHLSTPPPAPPQHRPFLPLRSLSSRISSSSSSGIHHHHGGEGVLSCRHVVEEIDIFQQDDDILLPSAVATSMLPSTRRDAVQQPESAPHTTTTTTHFSEEANDSSVQYQHFPASVPHHHAMAAAAHVLPLPWIDAIVYLYDGSAAQQHHHHHRKNDNSIADTQLPPPTGIRIRQCIPPELYRAHVTSPGHAATASAAAVLPFARHRADHRQPGVPLFAPKDDDVSMPPHIPISCAPTLMEEGNGGSLNAMSSCPPVIRSRQDDDHPYHDSTSHHYRSTSKTVSHDNEDEGGAAFPTARHPRRHSHAFTDHVPEAHDADDQASQSTTSSLSSISTNAGGDEEGAVVEAAFPRARRATTENDTTHFGASIDAQAKLHRSDSALAVDQPVGSQHHATARLCIALHLHVAQHLFLAPLAASRDAHRHGHSKLSTGCSAGVPPQIAAAASTLRQAFKFLARAPLRCATPSSTTATPCGISDDLLQYMALHAVHARDALSCAQYCFPWIAAKMEDTVHNALLRVMSSSPSSFHMGGGSSGGFAELARAIKFVAPLASMRDISIPISAAFHHAVVTFVKHFLQKKMPPLPSTTHCNPLPPPPRRVDIGWLQDVTHAISHEHNSTQASESQASTCYYHPPTPQPDAHCVVAEALKGDVNVFLSLAPQVFRTLLNDHEVLSVLKSSLPSSPLHGNSSSSSSISTAPLHSDLCVHTRWLLMLVSWCHWSTSGMTCASKIRTALTISRAPDTAIEAAMHLLALLLLQADASHAAVVGVSSQRSTQQQASATQQYFSQTSLSSGVYRTHGAAVSISRPPTTAVFFLPCDINRLRELMEKYRAEVG